MQQALWNNLRYGLRMLKKNPGFSAVAVLTLALGIGACTVMFSVISAVLFHPFPYKDSNRLATFQILFPSRDTVGRFPIPAFLDFKEQNHVFDDMFGVVFWPVRWKVGEGTEEFWGAWMTPDAFESLGIKPLLGRPVSLEDGKPGSPPVFVMSYDLWDKHFNRDPRVVGTSVTLNGQSRELIAVMPPRFRLGDANLWIPLALARDTRLSGWRLAPNEVWGIGHLKPGVTPEAASADLDLIAKRLDKTYPTYFPPQSKLIVNSLRDDYVAQFRPTLFALMTAVTMLLLIACSNVANLLLARATAREREIAVRAALGASRTRLIVQLLVESLVLAAGSCCAGCVFAYFGVKAATAAIPPTALPGEIAIALDPGALCFALSLAILATLLGSLGPAVHLARGDLRGALSSSAKGAGASFAHAQLRSLLVSAEVALSIILLVGSGLMVRTLVAILRVDLGFDPRTVFYAGLSFPEGRYDTAQQKKVFFQQALERLTAVPGVVSATAVNSFPPYSWGWTSIIVFGKTHPETWGATFTMCSVGYFATLERHLLRGRLLSESDVDSTNRVAVVNQTLVRDYFGSENPIGAKIKFSSFEMYGDWPRDAYFEIIGVVADMKNHGLEDPPRPEAYFPYTFTGVGPRGILVRTTGTSESILESVRREIRATDGDVVIAEMGSIQSYLKRWEYAEPQFTLATLGSVAVIGLVLVVVGVFSVTAYTVSLQTREIGIRMALGAQQSDIMRMILSNGLRMVVAGGVAGLLGAFWLTRFLSSEIWGVSRTDPWTFAAVGAAIICVGVAACLLPARRATSIDPLVALRYE